VPEHVLWGLCRDAEIEAYWLAGPSEGGAGAVHLQGPDPSDDLLNYIVERESGATYSAISFYRQLLQEAAKDPATPLETLTKAALAQELRVHLTVTSDPKLLTLSGFYARRCNAMNTADALAALGLYLRRHDPTLVASAPKIRFTFGNHELAWSAVRSQLPSGWTWSRALGSHSTTTNDDYASLLSGSFFERLVRMLNHRDNIHRATLQPATNKTGNHATEALDTMMFNVVGAFDATAIAAHLGAGRPPEGRKRAGWQWKDWRKDLNVPHLYAMFHRTQPAEDVLTVCRRLRNTVHGAGLSSMVSSRFTSKETFVRLPQSEAVEIVDRLNRLAPADTWGIEHGARDSIYVDPARLAEGLIPHIFTTLEEILEHTPLDQLDGTGPMTQNPPTRGGFDLNTRVRASLLYGLVPPTV
jgi:hypothetical protein